LKRYATESVLHSQYCFLTIMPRKAAKTTIKDRRLGRFKKKGGKGESCKVNILCFPARERRLEFVKELLICISMSLYN